MSSPYCTKFILTPCNVTVEQHALTVTPLPINSFVLDQETKKALTDDTVFVPLVQKYWYSIGSKTQQLLASHNNTAGDRESFLEWLSACSDHIDEYLGL